ncbi:MAG TPA: SIMPL domain-containing protein [Longimicrobiales bacterium]
MYLLLCVLLLLAPTAAWAQQPAAPTEPTVVVSATGVVRRPPDRAALMLAVESFAATAAEATRQNAEAMATLLAALERLRIADEDVQTTSYRLQPEYDYQRDPGPRDRGEDRLVGFRATNMVQVTIHDVERVGQVIDAAVGAGANRVTGLSFQISDPEAARLEALRLAVEKARTEAAAVAQAMGRTLGPAISVRTDGVVPPPPIPMMRASADFSVAAPTPIEPGELEVRASVTAVYRLGGPER